MVSMLQSAYDLSDWPSTGRWEVKKNAHKIGHGMVIEVNPAGVGGKVCDYNFTVHGEWIAAVDPATVAAMLRELAVLRTLTNGETGLSDEVESSDRIVSFIFRRRFCLTSSGFVWTCGGILKSWVWRERRQ